MLASRRRGVFSVSARGTLFHVSTAHFPTTTILYPGRWGNSLRSFKTNTLIDAPNRSILLWETLLENARLSLKPDATSRLKCVFACDTIEGATHFRNKCKQGGKIYEAEWASDERTCFRANLTTLDFDGRVMPLLEWYIDRGNHYWTDEPGDGPIELLCAGPIRITRETGL